MTPIRSLTEAHRPLTSKEGWARFVDSHPPDLTLLAAAELAGLDSVERADYDEARIDHHARLVVVRTPPVRQVIHTGRQLTVLNRHQVAARRGLIVTGPPGTGKTTAITQLGNAHEQLIRRRNHSGVQLMPVVYVTVPPAATPRMLAAEFAHFLGLPLATRMNQAEITTAVCGVLCDLGCELVIVDEIHNLNLGTRAGAEASDQLKYLAERIPATFVYAGIDVEHAGLFAGTRGRQIAGRFVCVTASPFLNTTAARRSEWDGLVVTFEQTLRLHRHVAGSLLTLSEYLHQRTGGMIGSLAHLLRAAAIAAIG